MAQPVGKGGSTFPCADGSTSTFAMQPQISPDFFLGPLTDISSVLGWRIQAHRRWSLRCASIPNKLTNILQKQSLVSGHGEPAHHRMGRLKWPTGLTWSPGHVFREGRHLGDTSKPARYDKAPPYDGALSVSIPDGLPALPPPGIQSRI